MKGQQPRAEQDHADAGHHEKPVPLPPRSPASASQVRMRNRRREYLRQNPLYLADLDHELADPVKYEALVRRFQTQAERDEEAKGKGYSRVLEGDLMRGEAKLALLKAGLTEEEDGTDVDALPASRQGDAGHLRADHDTDYDNGVDPATKEEGREIWDEYLVERFVKGGDPDFDYSAVDNDEDLDTMEMQDAQDTWFDDEEPCWARDDDDQGDAKVPRGETGVQDF